MPVDPKLPAHPVARARVWLVEDSPLQLERTRALLAPHHDVEGFSAGEAMLERLAASAPDLLILDWALPGLSGVELCRFIRGQLDEVALPILMLTSKAAPRDVEEALAAGANDHVTKPYSEFDLLARVRTLLRVRQLGRALEEREARLSTTLHSIGDAVISCDTEGRITFMNGVAERLTGWTQAEALQQPMAQVFRIINEHSRETVPSPVERVLREGVVVGLANHTLLVRKDGAETPIDDSAAPIRSAQGALEGVVLVFRDVSAQKKLERERDALHVREREAREELRLVMDALPAPISFVTAEQRYLLVNRAYEEWFGQPQGSVLGKTVREFVGEAAYAKLAPRVARGLSGERLVWEEEGVAYRNGGTRDVRGTFVPHRSDDGAVKGFVALLEDITEPRRHAAEREALLASEAAAHAQLRLVMDAIPLLVSFVAADETYVLVNRTYEEWFGLTQAQMVGRSVREVIGEAAYAVLGPYVKRALAGERFDFEQHHVPYRTGGTRDVKISFVPRRGEDGRVAGYVALLEDITVRRRLALEREALLVREAAAHAQTQLEREKLQVSEERLRRVVAASGTGTWDLDVATGLTTGDAHHEAMIRAPQGAGRVHAERFAAVHADDRATVEQAFARAAAGTDGGKVHAEFRLVPAADQPERWLELRGNATFGEGGQALHVSGTSLDITARKQAEAAKQEASARVTEVLESMGDAFFALDADWRFTLVNQHYEEISHHARADALGKRFWDLHPDAARPDSSFFAQYHRCMDERVPVQFLGFYAPLEIWTSVHAYPTADGGMAVFFRDVTSEKRAEQAVQRQAEFEKQLVGIVSHDLRNPLNVISMAAQVLSLGGALPAPAAKAAARIERAAHRATQLVRDLLDFTQARLGGRIPIHPRAIDLSTLTRAVLDEVEAAHPDRVLQAQLTPDLQGQWDEGRLSQVVQNLLTNALKYSPRDSAVQVATRRDGDAVVLSVHNTGTPIPPSMQEIIFEPLKRGPAETDQTGRSIGLGLFIVKQVLDAHHGSIAVRSSEAEGTTFTVRLPAPQSTGQDTAR